MKLKLIDDWKDCWRWSSTRLLGITGALTTTWLAVPADLRAAAPAWLLAAAVLALVVLGTIARVTVFEIKQKPPVPVKQIKKPTKKRKR